VPPLLIKVVKGILFHSPLKRFIFPRYGYQFDPAQLCFLCRCVESTQHVDGAIAEVGCSDGFSTLFINKLLDTLGSQKTYYALDTFSGFVDEDIALEVTQRGKKSSLYNGFRSNNKKWFDGTMHMNGVSRVQSIEADVNRYDLRTLGALSFVLLDVDLYRPIKKALPELYEKLSPNGIIVVDDCDASNIRWDGADQAYKEFMASIKQTPEIVHGKLGVVRKTA
jgi:O-methyltransferase